MASNSGGGGAGGSAGASSALTRIERNARTNALLAKLAEADDSLAQVLDLAAQAIDTLLPASSAADATGDGATGGSGDGGIERFETSATDYFALMNDIQLFLRSAVFHLVHNVKRAPLTPAQTSSAFNALRAATVTKGHSLRPEDIAQQNSAAPPAQVPAGDKASAPTVEEGGTAKEAGGAKPSIVGLPDDARLSLGALRIQHKAWSDLAAALEALQ
ncbi:unnamed protein product [Tilletia controversa]|uniref:Mediator of RNA polymerase II transcription subunit 11 n=5 Tax=Tilletia TaxID=13289 RepID=A0A8X7ST43_9BASI|nr:hypothetical protein CF336_g8724 [Tilletia laevis]KAE8182716.1 hypothetical protein CF328_g8418 [Tilletia controversa]KAE8240798.1 hypothetical protein A4X03_0g8350 [Tilletia caries]KAE8183248.1 hypothetical protein CF335_g8380 [Tilletia laevis]KAE8239110.1 hypothetical protein A4X06_0g8504 [Tilletia controversa]